jgi:hypothetical protein
MSQLGHSRPKWIVRAASAFTPTARKFISENQKLCFPSDPNQFYIAPVPAHTKGAFRDRHERRAGMRWTRKHESANFARTNGLTRTAKPCGPDAPTLASSWRRKSSAGDGGKKARSPGRARRKPLTPSRAGMPGDSGATVVTNACVYYSTHAAAGASGTRHSPRPPFQGGRFLQQLGRIARRECGVVSCRHCEERSDEVIHVAARKEWIASLRSQ